MIVADFEQFCFTILRFFFTMLSCSRASDFGLMKIDNKGRVLSFSEKPKGEDLKAMVIVNLIVLIQNSNFLTVWLLMLISVNLSI